MKKLILITVIIATITTDANALSSCRTCGAARLAYKMKVLNSTTPPLAPVVVNPTAPIVTQPTPNQVIEGGLPVNPPDPAPAAETVVPAP
jgi:hypothetical protein